MKPTTSSFKLLVPALLLGLAAATPAALNLDAGKSRVTVSFRQMNVPVEGSFGVISGAVDYDPARPQAASAKLLIDTASFDIGDADYNAEVRKKEWFDSKTWPQAAFVSSGIKPAGANTFTATGTLSIKGKTQNLSLPVTVKSEPAATVFEGRLPVSRKQFGIGDPAWDEVVEDQVIVAFRIVQPK